MTTTTIALGPYVTGEIPYPIDYQFLDDTGVQLDTGTMTAKFNWRNASTHGPAYERPCDYDSTTATATYAWQAGDLASAGVWIGEMWIEAAGNKLASQLFTWIVRPSVVDGDPTETPPLAADLAAKVSKTGDVMTGPLLLSGDPTDDLQAATKGYVDAAASADAVDLAAVQAELDNEETARAAADAQLIPLAQKGAANGVATLDVGSKIPDGQIPDAITRDTELTAVQVELDAETAARIAADTAEGTARAIADSLLIPLAQKGAANGVATLDVGSKIPDGQIPDAITRDAELAAAVAVETARALVAEASLTARLATGYTYEFFESVHGGGGLGSIDSSFFNPKHLIVGSDVGGIRFSFDGGHHWVTRMAGMLAYQNRKVSAVKWSKTVQGKCYATVGDGTTAGSGVYYSLNFGKLWTRLDVGFGTSLHFQGGNNTAGSPVDVGSWPRSCGNLIDLDEANGHLYVGSYDDGVWRIDFNTTTHAATAITQFSGTAGLYIRAIRLLRSFQGDGTLTDLWIAPFDVAAPKKLMRSQNANTGAPPSATSLSDASVPSNCECLDFMFGTGSQATKMIIAGTGTTTGGLYLATNTGSNDAGLKMARLTGGPETTSTWMSVRGFERYDGQYEIWTSTPNAAAESTAGYETANYRSIYRGLLSVRLIASASRDGAGTATYGTTLPHGLTVGDTMLLTGMSPTAYNGAFTVVATPTTTSFTVALAGGPDAATAFGRVVKTNLSWTVIGPNQSAIKRSAPGADGMPWWRDYPTGPPGTWLGNSGHASGEIAVDRRDLTRVYFPSRGVVWGTEDGGATFVPFVYEIGGQIPNHHKCDPNTSGRVVFVSSDNCALFTESGFDRGEVAYLAVPDSVSDGLGWACHISTNGRVWVACASSTPPSTHEKVYSALDPFKGWTDELWDVTDGGDTNQPTPIGLWSGVDAQGVEFVIGVGDVGYGVWRKQRTGTWAGTNNAAGAVTVAAGAWGRMRPFTLATGASDPFATATDLNSTPTGQAGRNAGKDVQFAQSGEHIFCLDRAKGKVWRFSDYGRTPGVCVWSKGSAITSVTQQTCGYLAVDPLVPTRLWVGSDDGLWLLELATTLVAAAGTLVGFSAGLPQAGVICGPMTILPDGTLVVVTPGSDGTNALTSKLLEITSPASTFTAIDRADDRFRAHMVWPMGIALDANGTDIYVAAYGVGILRCRRKHAIA